MNIDTIGTLVSIQNSPFYKNEIIRPFIDAYLIKPDLVKEDDRFQLFKKYLFGVNSKLNLTNDELYYFNNHFDIFIGYRFLSKKYHPFFLSIREISDQEFEVTGYSTFMDDDLDRDYYKFYQILPNFKSTSFSLHLTKDSYHSQTFSGLDMSLYESLSEMSKKTEKRNKILKAKMKAV